MVDGLERGGGGVDRLPMDLRLLPGLKRLRADCEDEFSPHAPSSGKPLKPAGDRLLAGGGGLVPGLVAQNAVPQSEAAVVDPSHAGGHVPRCDVAVSRQPPASDGVEPFASRGVRQIQGTRPPRPRPSPAAGGHGRADRVVASARPLERQAVAVPCPRRGGLAGGSRQPLSRRYGPEVCVALPPSALATATIPSR